MNAAIPRRSDKEKKMKYAFTIYGDESQRESATPEQQEQMAQAYGAITQEMDQKGVLVAGEGLYPTQTATDRAGARGRNRASS